MQAAVPIGEGSMVAVLGLKFNEVKINKLKNKNESTVLVK